VYPDEERGTDPRAARHHHIDLVKKAADPDEGYRYLRVVFGDLLEFEPAKIVDVWRIKSV
jgi:hypothetical protein